MKKLERREIINETIKSNLGFKLRKTINGLMF